jgi:hypothetical protein
VRTMTAMRSHQYYRLHEPGDRPPGDEILQRFIADFERTGAVDRCAQRYREEGMPEVRFTLFNEDEESEFDPVGLSFQLKGPLARTPLGTCIADEIRVALDAVQLPNRYQSAVRSVQLSGTK